jgi:hypothetical protein
MDNEQLHNLLDKALEIDRNRSYVERFLKMIISPVFNKLPETTTDSPACQPLDETPASTPGKPLDETPASTPGKPLDETPASTPGKPLDENPASTPGKPLDETPAGKPLDETPADKPLDETPASTPGKPLDETPASTPGKPLDETPASTPGKLLDETPASTPDKPLDETPVGKPLDATPVSTPGKPLDETPSSTPAGKPLDETTIVKKPINIIYLGKLRPDDGIFTKILEKFSHNENSKYTATKQWDDNIPHNYIILKEFDSCECIRSYEYGVSGSFHKETIYKDKIPQRIYGVDSDGYYIHEAGAYKKPDYDYGTIFYYTSEHKLRRVSDGKIAVYLGEKDGEYIIDNLIGSPNPDSNLAATFINYVKNNKRDVLGFNMIV